MADDATNELLLEHLKKVQTKLSDMHGDITDVKADLRAIKSHMAGFMQSEVAQDGAIAQMQRDLERIKRRLDLVDEG
ncbi:hypothetical protein [uncultured Ruegeria sp.]|uniref:hypothetical protein n=1 Tax=uncultured Ruegeria sp. TaxID=259304 RepID=UPI0026379E5B|nr:hypothetical protein [uncultured Ruegeria sp.]